MPTNIETIEKLRAKYAGLIDQAKRLTPADGNMTQETADQINGLLGQADEAKAQLQLLQRVAAGDEYLNDPANPPKAASGGWRPSGPGEGDEAIDVKSWREFEINVPTPQGMQKKSIRYHVPLAVQKKGYESAYEAYLRKGIMDMGPNDRKALQEATDAAGGYLVPADAQAVVIKKIATLATVRMFARVITTSRDIVKWTRRKYTSDNKYTAGARLTWTGETPSSSTVHRVTDQVFGQIDIPINTAMASQLISMDLLEDAAYDVLGDSMEVLAEAFALGENATFWSGNGAGQPRGILTDASDTTNWDAAVQTAVTANAIDADEVIDVNYALPAQYERNARWFMTKATEKYLRKLKDADSDYIWPVKALVGGFGPISAELLGFPTTRDEFMDGISDATNTTTYPLVFGDLSGYVVADRVGLSLKRDDSLYSETNQVLLLGRKRVGGQLAEAYRLSLLKTVNST